jgi:hypothetical protein
VLNNFNDVEIRLRTMVIAMLGLTPVSQDQIRDALIRFQELFPGQEIDTEKIVRNVEVCLNVLVGGVSGVIGDDIDHIEWLGAEKTKISWSYWDRYKYYLLNIKNLPLAVVENLEDTTDSVLGRLEKASREGQWDRRGMVVGHVQSGKTAHYTGLICKAVDSGYKLIVVLAGSDNGLRAQTQLRIDEGFLGFTMGYGVGDQQGQKIGVGLLPQMFGQNLHPASFTTAAENGDFKLNVARGMGIVPGAMPIVLVVKKNSTVLENLSNWSKAILGSDRDGVHKIPDVPVLVIDDECDYASVNTKNTLYDFERNQNLVEPTKINGHIRKYLNMFDRSAYVGYTATPFANIFIYHQPGKEDKIYGEDLFPRSFIICLPRSSDYMGADQVFGLQEAVLQGIEQKDSLPILRPFDDLSSWISPAHKIDWKPPLQEVPKSLVDAILSFVLVCAARMSRGQTHEHNSMLVHLTRFVAVQGEIKTVILRELQKIRNAIRNSAAPEGRPIYTELKKLWESDFLETTIEFNDPNLRPIPWHEIETSLRAAVEKIEVKVINGTAEDALQYFNNQALGVSVIAVGGAKLSRGLTLEGLSVSYFQRTTKMYDTLMQMGRWFGYRPGYRDFCRLSTTQELIGWYQDITMATEELYNQFEEMVLFNKTPKEFGLKVAQSPQNLLITAKVKMRNASLAKLSYRGGEASYRLIKANNVAESIKVTKNLMRWAKTNYLSHPTEGKPSYLYKECSPEGVIRFLTDFPRYPGATDADPKLLRDYIDLCVKQGELTSWSVAFVSIADSSRKLELIEGHEIYLQKRKNHDRKNNDRGRDRFIKTLWSGEDQSLGLSPAELQKATSDAAKAGKKLDGCFYRNGRDTSHGLLAIYFIETQALFEQETDPNDLGDFSGFPYVPCFALSFPASETAPALDYVVRNDYFGTDDDDEEDDK